MMREWEISSRNQWLRAAGSRFDKLIRFITDCETIYPGEVLCSGTVGHGCGLENGRLLADGDVIELEIEGIGVLRNTVRAT